MGNYPSVNSVPSTAVAEDIALLKKLFPDKFKVETTANTNGKDDNHTATLFANDGKMTLILVATTTATAASTPVATALVMDGHDIKAVMKRQGITNGKLNYNGADYVTTDIQLPGGAILVLVTPTMLGSKAGRQRLAELLTQHSRNNNSNEPQQQQQQQLQVNCSGGIAERVNNGHSSDGNSSPRTVMGDDHHHHHMNGNIATAAMTITTTPIKQQPKPQQTPTVQLPSFPTLDFRLLQENGRLQANFPLNAREGEPFENDLFKGKVLVLLRPTNNPAEEDPYWNEKIWKHKQRRVIVQVQGKFKREPQGILFAGGEVSDPMQLGLLAKGLTKVLLKLLRSFYPTIHTSFGDDEELAHIVVPAYRFFERLIVTKPGETPPTMGEPFNESAKSIKARKASQSTGDWNTTDTYSMSFYSMYIDLPTWSVVNIPMSNDMPLSTFWGKSSLTICFYDRVAPESVTKHMPQYNTYGFGIRIKHLGASGASSSTSSSTRSSSQRTKTVVDRVPNSDDEGDAVEDMSSGEDDARGNILDWTETPLRERERLLTSSTNSNDSNAFMPHSDSQVFLVDEEEDADEVSVFDINQFFDAEEYRDSTEDFTDVSGSISSLAPEQLTSVDNLCPAWMEMLVHRGNYARTYAFNLPDSSSTVFRKADWVLSLFGSKGPNDSLPLSTRLSSAEQTRRHLGQLISSSVGDGNNNDKSANKKRLEVLQSTSTPYDGQFLRRKRPNIPEKSKVQASCFVSRALSDHHWIEEWASITERGVNFYHPERKKANHRVAIQSIARVNKLDSKASPRFPNYSFLSFETLGRTTYLMFASEEDRDKWVTIISRLAKLAPSAVDQLETESDGHASTALLELQNPKDEFLHKSSLWDFKHRRVLNCRRFSFRAREKASQQDPLSLAEDALRKALDPRNESDDDILVAFLDSAAKLKEANVHGLGEEERLVFFMNVYHTMVMHAYLVLGTPASSFQWISYFNSISYQCSDDIFSLAELEHCILRSAMSYPTQFLSRFACPKSSYSFALTKSDYRINFALNCGSLSNPKCVPVFNVSSLNQQLDDVSRLYLAAAVKLKKRSSRDVDVFLPRICLWFADDFGSSNTDVLRRVTPFLTSDVQEFLKSIESGERGKCSVSVKYLNYSFECRKLTLTPDAGRCC